MLVLPFGRLPDGTPISEIRLTTAAGASASIITRGATVRDLAVPLPNDETRRVVLGYPTLDGYLADTSYLGATAGRYASRIGGGRFQLDGSLYYQLTLNEANQTHLHGGTQGFSHRPWQILSNGLSAIRQATRFLLRPPFRPGSRGRRTCLGRYGAFAG